MKTFIRISRPIDDKILRDVQYSEIVNFNGKVIDLRLAIYFKNILKEITRNSNYFIDPDLSFIRCWSPLEKRTVLKLFEFCKIHDVHPGLKEKTLSEEYINDKTKELLVRCILELERNPAITQLRGLEELFSEFISGEQRSNLIAIVPPYFPIMDVNEVYSVWYSANLDMINIALNMRRKGERVYVVIAISKDVLLHENAIKKIISDYTSFSKDVDGFLIWVIDLDEVSNHGELKHLVNFLRRLREGVKTKNVKIINMYGGYFSLLLVMLGLLDGVIMRVCYRQGRRPCQEVKGFVKENYYFSPLKTKIDLGLALNIMRLEPSWICQCPICEGKQLFNKFQKLKSEDLNKHFIYTLSREIEELRNSTIEDTIRKLRSLYERLRELRVHTFIDIEHISTWASILNKELELKKP